MVNENEYHPFTADEFNNLKSVLDSITTHIPTNQAGYIWNSFIKVTGVKEPQPCNCGSSAKHWRRAYQTLREFIYERTQSETGDSLS